MSASQPLASASVILLDPQRGGGEPFGLYLLRRRAESRFMPNRFVFPGGRVDPHDGPDPASDQALRVCALRELWEESGVLLAPELERGGGPDTRELNRARRALQEQGAGLAQALAGLGLSLHLTALRPYARWITPQARSQRFDTLFFLARMPAGQEADADRQETSEGLWLGPRQALAENLEGRVELAPPQVRILGELAAAGGLDRLWESAGAGGLEPVLPVLWIRGEQRVILLPADPDYAAGAPGDPDNPGLACPAHQATRLVHSQGRWRPCRP